MSASPRDSDWHMLPLFSTILQNKSKSILELGVRHGDTTEPMIAAASLTGGRITCVDINPTQWQCPSDLSHMYEFILSDAIEFLNKSVSENRYFDFVYIDDWHTYQHVREELDLISKITDTRSIVVLHDLMGSGTAPNYFNPISYQGTEWDGGGPYRAVSELDPRQWEWMTMPVNNGLTYLRKRSQSINL